MQANESIEFYLRFLNEQLAQVRESVDGLLRILPENNQPQKVETAKGAALTVGALLKGLSKQDQPRWANQLLKALQRYIENPGRQGAGHSLLKQIVLIYPAMTEHSWKIADDHTSVDFEGAYQRFIDESRVPELFDKLIEKLKALVESGKIDSVRVVRALEQVIATLRRNSRRSYFSTHAAWEFTNAAFKNFLWEALEDIPGAGAAVRAIRKTVDELDREMSALRSNVNEEVVHLASADVLSIEPARTVALLQSAGAGEPELNSQAEDAEA